MSTLNQWFEEHHGEIYSLTLIAHRHERLGHTLTPTCLVNELFLTLRGSLTSQRNDDSYRFAAVRKALVRLLIDYARSKNASKRNRGNRPISLAAHACPTLPTQECRTSLHEQLEQLELTHPRSADALKLRYHLGLSCDQIANRLDVSVRTIQLDLRFADAFLMAGHEK